MTLLAEYDHTMTISNTEHGGHFCVSSGHRSMYVADPLAAHAISNIHGVRYMYEFHSLGRPVFDRRCWPGDSGHQHLIGRPVFSLQLRPYTLSPAAATKVPCNQYHKPQHFPDRPNKRKGQHPCIESCMISLKIYDTQAKVSDMLDCSPEHAPHRVMQNMGEVGLGTSQPISRAEPRRSTRGLVSWNPLFEGLRYDSFESLYGRQVFHP